MKPPTPRQLSDLEAAAAEAHPLFVANEWTWLAAAALHAPDSATLQLGAAQLLLGPAARIGHHRWKPY